MSLAAFREQRADAKRAAVLASAREVFAADGYAGAATAEIARRADVSTATVYRYFPTKLDLFAAVIEAGVDELRIGLRRGEQAGLDALSIAYADLLSRPAVRKIVRLVVGEIGTGSPLAERFFASGKAATVDVFQAAVDREIADKRVTADANAGQLSGMIEHATLMVGLLAGSDRPTTLPPEEIARQALLTWRARFGR